MVNNIKGLERIRFATSHPKDLSDELIYAMRDLNKVCTHMHLPVQSGSNKILKSMNRKYTREKYIERVQKLKSICPEVSLSSDMIVGFPGETEEDFQETLDLIKTVEFDSLFAFIYSDRPNAPAAKFSEKIELEVKKGRLQKLLDFQKELSQGKNGELLGKHEEVMVEGYSTIKPEFKERYGILSEIQWTGRTSGNKIVNFVPPADSSCSDSLKVGNIVNVRIEKALPNSILGVMVADQTPN
jgi:tRNA-2-methylthio-N6-dimethylallyladenosine synthase